MSFLKDSLKIAFWILAPFGFMLLVLWPFTWEPPPPNPNPPNGTIYATVGGAAMAWSFAAILAYMGKRAGDEMDKEGLKVVATIFLVAGWGLIALLLVSYFAWECNIWPWEPATCLNT